MLRHDLTCRNGVSRAGQTHGNLTCIPLPNVVVQQHPRFNDGQAGRSGQTDGARAAGVGYSAPRVACRASRPCR